MVFDVGRALDILGIGGIALELREDRREGLAHEIGQHVEPAAMGHADHHLVDAELAAALQDLLQRRDQRSRRRPGRSAWCRCICGRGSARSTSAAVSRSRIACLPSAVNSVWLRIDFDALLDPGLLGRVLDMHELDADLAAIGGAQLGQDLAQRRGLEAQDIADEDRPVHIGLGEAVGRGIELGMGLDRLQAQRIEIGLQMAAHAIGADEHAGRGSNPWPRRAAPRCFGLSGRCRFARHRGAAAGAAAPLAALAIAGADCHWP